VATGAIEALIDEGHGAFERGDADASRRAFAAARAESESGELFEGFARALYLAGDYRGSIEAHERGFAAYKDEGDPLSGPDGSDPLLAAPQRLWRLRGGGRVVDEG